MYSSPTCEALSSVLAGPSVVSPAAATSASHRVSHVGRAGLLRVGVSAGPAEASTAATSAIAVAPLSPEGAVVAAHRATDAVATTTTPAHASTAAAASEPVASHPAAAHRAPAAAAAATAAAVSVATATRGRELDADLVALEVVSVELAQNLVHLVALDFGVDVHEAEVLDDVSLDDRAIALEHLRSERRVEH